MDQVLSVFQEWSSWSLLELVEGGFGERGRLEVDWRVDVGASPAHLGIRSLGMETPYDCRSIDVRYDEDVKNRSQVWRIL